MVSQQSLNSIIEYHIYKMKRERMKEREYWESEEGGNEEGEERKKD